MNSDIKICGLRREEDAFYINEFEEIKYAGLVFAKSKRQIDIQTALKIKNKLRKDIQTVGVFADMSISEIQEIADAVGLDKIQLHSDESPEFCSSINGKIWKSISVKDETSTSIAPHYKGLVEGFLLDTYNKDMRGGSGEAFNWNIAKDFSKNYLTILAGGISEGNIQEALEIVSPSVIDLSSSVETDGFKDYDKIKSLIGRIRNGTEQ